VCSHTYPAPLVSEHIYPALLDQVMMQVVVVQLTPSPPRRSVEILKIQLHSTAMS
jgi:hypothetical protein